MSVQKIQSELGFIGEASPNLEMINAMAEQLDETFKHTHGTITDQDCILFISAVRVGKRIDDGEDYMGFICHQAGCNIDIAGLLIKWMLHNPDALDIIYHAIQTEQKN